MSGDELRTLERIEADLIRQINAADGEDSSLLEELAAVQWAGPVPRPGEE